MRELTVREYLRVSKDDRRTGKSPDQQHNEKLANHRINSKTKPCSHSSEKASPCPPPSLTVMLTVARADTHAPPVKTSSSWSETSKTTCSELVFWHCGSPAVAPGK